MANIFHRPMFRRGGSVANGTGITSGLDQPRAKYADGPDEEGVNYKDATDEALSKIGNVDPEKIALAMDVIKSKLMPTPEESVSDFLTSFGSSAGSPTELQTWGSALGKTAQRYQALEQQKRQLAEKYAGIGAVSTLKSMTKNPVVDEMERKATLVAINRDAPNSKYKGMSYEQAKAAALNDLINKKTLIREYSMEKSPKAQLEIDARDFMKDTGIQDKNIAKEYLTIRDQIEKDPKFADEKDRWKGLLKITQVEKTPTNTYKLKQNVINSPTGRNYKANDLFYDANSRTVYMYTGPATGEFVPYRLYKNK